MRPGVLLGTIIVVMSVPGVVIGDCPGESTREMEKCLSKERDSAAASLERYKEEVLRILSGHLNAREAFSASQVAWREYSKAECRAVYVNWKDGSIRNVQFLVCQVRLASERAWSLWSTYLRGMETDLPEPRRWQLHGDNHTEQ